MKNDELAVSLISSSDLKGRLDEIVILFRHRFVVFALCAPIPVIVLVSRRGDGLPVWLDGASYAAGVVTLFATLGLMAYALRRLIHRPALLRVPFLLMNVPAVIAGIAVAEALRILSGAAPHSPVDLAAAAVLIIILLEASMSLAGRSFLATALTRRRDAGGEWSTAPARAAERPSVVFVPADLPQSVRIGGRDIALSDLSHITGEGSMVIVQFGSLSLRLSARFATVMASIPDEAGMQINRMVWVSAPKAARSQLLKSGRETVLQLPDGTKLSVAPNRRTELAAWIRAMQGTP